jgi:hypothetical protein
MRSSEKKNTVFSFFALLVFLMPISALQSQNKQDSFSIPVYRQYYHDKINKEQAAIDKLDGKYDQLYNATQQPELNEHLSYSLCQQLDDLQTYIETQQLIPANNDKIRALSFIENTLIKYRTRLKSKLVSPIDLPLLVDQLSIAIKALPVKTPVNKLIEKTPYGISLILQEVFMEFPESDRAAELIYLKYITLFPEDILATIGDHISADYADSLINLAAARYPSEVYTQAQSSETVLGKAIQKNPLPLVKTIVQISRMPNAMMYFPFLDELQSGKKTFEELKQFIRNGEEEFDSVGYYKLLVRTEQAYFSRMTSAIRDTPIAMFGVNGLTETLRQRAIQHFITPINQLHDEANLNKRMRSIDSLNAVELYYMMVMGENEIYTSSFKHSFHRMLTRMGATPRTDSLLLKLRFEFFRKFIKMCAGYNKLDTFLRLMPAKSANLLFKAFVSNLEKENALEDATDVADAFSSISDLELRKKVMAYIEENEKRQQQKNNSRGMLIYGLLKNIFRSESGEHIDLKTIAGVESVYEIETKKLMDDSGRIVQQVFFYGDEDGKAFFPSFLKSFESANWKITKKAEWVEIHSLKTKLSVYANLPLNYDANLDDSAQQHLNEYLASKGMKPSIVIHRGHSYWLPGTINRMPESAKVVIIGSCGGYKNLSRILQVAPDAQIISTKEIGAGDINRPIMNEMNQVLLTKPVVVWKELWQTLTSQFNLEGNTALRETWENYIPPYRNLGAIFIKAYQRKVIAL